MSDGVYACVVDEGARFHLEALRWYACLTRVAGIDAGDLVLAAVDGTDSPTLAFLRERGVKVPAIEPFDRSKPHTNKISGARSLGAAGVTGMAVLTDADVSICEDVRTLPIPARGVGMKIVDIDNPPFETACRVFEAAGVPLPEVQAPDFAPDRQTLSVNCNGGVYVVRGEDLPELAEAWARRARWLLGKLDELRLTRAVDQMSMALVVSGDGFHHHPLGRRWNLPTYPPEWDLSREQAPAVIHYHRGLGEDGLLTLTGVPAVDARIRTCNDAISEVYALAFGRDVEAALAEARPPVPLRRQRLARRVRQIIRR